MTFRAAIKDPFLRFMGFFSICALAIVFTSAHGNPVQAQTVAQAKYKYIATATTTPVTDGPSFLNSVIVNGGTAGAVTLFDVAAASCSGTPGTGKFATIEAIAATNPTALPYNLRVTNGICVVTAQNTDLTVTFN